MATRPPRGFTLIEMMVVVGIVGILAALSVSTYIGIGRRAAPQNAAYDLSAALSRARARAVERSSNVYLVVFPQASRNGTGAGQGAWVLYEDIRNSFSLAAVTTPGAIVNSANGTVLARGWMEDYPAKNATLDLPAGGSPAEANNKVDSPFPQETMANIRSRLGATRGCAFCSGSGQSMRGAVLFTPEGGARFIRDDGTQYTGTDLVTRRNVPAVITLTDKPTSGTNQRSFIFAISRATAYVGFYSF